MGCKAYFGSDVQTGLGGYQRVTPPSWSGYKGKVWAHLYCFYLPQAGWECGVGVYGWEDPRSNKPHVLNWNDFSVEDQKLLLTTIEEKYHHHFPLKNG